MIRVVTDSASDLPITLRERLGVVVVPLEVRLGSIDPTELIDVGPERFWELAATTNALAETAAPSPGEFQQAFAKALEQGCEGVVCVTISSSLSATYQAARAGAAEFGDKVVVVDSRSATMGEGLLVLEAAELASSGSSLSTVAQGVCAAIDDVSVFGTLDTLDALKKGGRIGSAQAFIGSMLSIKPVVEVRNGVVEGESRQRTRQRSLRYLAEKVLGAGALKRLSVVHAASEDLDVMMDLLADVDVRDQMIISGIGPIIGAHTGQGTIGVAFQRANSRSGSHAVVTS